MDTIRDIENMSTPKITWNDEVFGRRYLVVNPRSTNGTNNFRNFENPNNWWQVIKKKIKDLLNAAKFPGVR
jgi:hypothetical protein